MCDHRTYFHSTLSDALGLAFLEFKSRRRLDALPKGGAVNHEHQTIAFAADLDALVERYRDEFDLTYAAAVGVLQIKTFLLCQEAAESKQQDDDNDP